ncbi:MAG: Crp/Fnr family transcriptional regulator [Bryobacterales bacterium]|nr:Crp/Fnr family transcriptional regulator [Bryobacterales bacterium]
MMAPLTLKHADAGSGARSAGAGRVPPDPPGKLPAPLEAFDVPAPVLRLPERAVLFEQGTPVKEVYYLVSGVIRLTHTRPGCPALTVGVRLGGSLVGGAAAVAAAEHPITAETVTPCQLQHFNRRDFRNLLARDLQFSRKVTAILCGELMGGVNQITGLLAMSSRERLEAQLQYLSEHRASYGGGGANRLALPVRLRDLAHLLGITPEHLSRLLTQLEKEGRLSRDKGWFVFHDPA